MSNPKRLILAAIFFASLGTFWQLTKPPPPPVESSTSKPSRNATTPPPTSPGDPDTSLSPGEFRPGEKPGTLVVQPFQPGPAKTISSNYRVPSHRDDARITRRSDGAVIFEQAIELSRRLHSNAVAPEEDVQILNAILSFYRLVYRTNPVAGDNLEVIAALTGNNEHKIIVLPPDHPDINDAGELMDRWGSPYFFHALSGTELDILSPGPDQKRNTRDDLSLGLGPAP